MNRTIKTFADNPRVAAEFAKDFVGLLQTLSDSRPKVTVALSGGSTPKLLFAVLANKLFSMNRYLFVRIERDG